MAFRAQSCSPARPVPTAQKAPSIAPAHRAAQLTPTQLRLAFGLQTKLAVSQPGDPLEIEADRVADHVMRLPAPQIQRTCAAGNAPCPKCKEEQHFQREPTSPNPTGTSSAPADFGSTLGNGQPLDTATRSFFEPRFGADFSQVRVHTGPRAAESAQSVHARAFALGSNVVFNSGEFAPHHDDGRRLIAHELAHTLQQRGTTPLLQRTLKVDAPASDDPATAIPQMTPLLNKLCPDFDVDAKSGAVTAKAASACAKGAFGTVATGKQSVGCCCLCSLARAPQPWRILVTIKGAPTTNSTGTVKMTPTAGSAAPDLRAWTAGPKETVTQLPPEDVLGHELCGHAALMQANAHPPDEDSSTARTFSDIHDPTIKIENKLAGEMALGTPARGLAASSAHRGESLRVFVAQPFAQDDATLSAAASGIVDSAVRFADANERLLIDTVGFRDGTDTQPTVGKSRAATVRGEMDARITKKSDVDFTLSKGAADTPIKRLQPEVDGGVGPAAAVEIRMAREPAGLQNLPAGVSLPPKPEHVKPKNPAVVDMVLKGKSTGNDCHDLLIRTAWK